MSFSTSEQEHGYELMEIRWFFHCPPPKKCKKPVWTTVIWKGVFFFFFLLSTLFICLNKIWRPETLTFAHMAQTCCCRGALHCLLLEPGSSLMHSLFFAEMPKQTRCHSTFEETPSSGSLVRTAEARGSQGVTPTNHWQKCQMNFFHTSGQNVLPFSL